VGGILDWVVSGLPWSRLDLKHKPDRGRKEHYQESGFRTGDSWEKLVESFQWVPEPSSNSSYSKSPFSLDFPM